MPRTPYPGLRAFRPDETDIFFGRDSCIHALVDRLAETHFLAVLGSSGTGKSSIVNTGVIQALDVGLMAEAGADWRVVNFRPKGAPLRSLAEALCKTRGGAFSEFDVQLNRGFLGRGPRALIEWCADGNLAKSANLLLIVDQFEELFRYQDYTGREEAEAFVALLLESAHSRDPSIYVTITMRSEYLGACALIEGLAEMISRGMVLTPRMTRDQCREAIEGPSLVCGAKVEAPLVNHLLNDLTNFAPLDDQGLGDQLDRLVRRADQLPLFQYALNQLWRRALENRDGGPIKLRLSDYQKIGGMSGALNTHADEIYQELTAKGLAVPVERVFRALVQGTTVAEAVRRPQKFGDLVDVCGGDANAVRQIIGRFRMSDCNYLVSDLDPDHETPSDRERIVDISHESLIRQWKQLSTWLATEAIDAQNWRRIVERYVDHEGGGDLLRGRELHNLAGWSEEAKPTEAWANRYGGKFKQAHAFLDESRREEASLRQRERKRRDTQRRYAVLSIVLLSVSLSIGVIAYLNYRNNSALQVLNTDLNHRYTELELSREELRKKTDELETAKSQLEGLNRDLTASRTALEHRNAELEQSTKALTAKTEELQKAQLALEQAMESEKIEQGRELNRVMAQLSAADSSAKRRALLGPIPEKASYAGETDDDHIEPSGMLQDSKNLDSPTPTSIPGGKTLTTKQLYNDLADGSFRTAKTPSDGGNEASDAVPIVLIDTQSDVQAPTLPAALRSPTSGAGGKYSDDAEKSLLELLSSAAKGNWKVAVVFFGRDSHSWAPYNAALRTIDLGFPNVYWYRGGVAAWQAAGLKLQ